jgi:hypothetical protein
VDALGSATSCVTSRQFVLLAPASVRDGSFAARFLDPGSLRSPDGGPSGLLLDASILFTVAQPDLPAVRRLWEPRMDMYRYRLLDRDQTELLVYHWQPGPDFAGPDHPHLHVSAAVRAKVDAMTTRTIDLDKLHIATGLVSLAAIVRMLIAEFDVAPQRADWRETLDRIEAAS